MNKNIFIGILTFFLLTTVLVINDVNTVDAADETYNVYVLSYKNENNKPTIDHGKSLLKTTNFKKAYDKMNELEKNNKDVIITSDKSPSPLKIIAATRAFAQSYPYRKNSTIGELTLKIHKNKSLSSQYTYISGHYPMYVHNFDDADSKIIEVEYQGARGFVDLYKTDIVPTIYIEKNVPILIGGTKKGDYYDVEKNENESPVNIVVVPDTYQSIEDTKYGNSLQLTYTRSYPTLSGGKMVYGIAPSFLKKGTKYYSLDGIQFYEDLDFKKPVGDKYYVYYQWLPIRSLSNITSVEFNSLLTKYNYNDIKNHRNYSVMVNSENAFVEYGHYYGMNPLLIFAQASLESAYGSSSFAKDRYNLFGWNAVDSNPNNASSYEGVEKAVEKFMNSQLTRYFNHDDYRYYGNSFGNKGSGVSNFYASDPHYGIKIAGIAYALDKDNGFKDYNAYDLFALSDNRTHAFKKSNNATSATFYNTRHTNNQIITNLELSKSYIKTNLGMSMNNGSITKEDKPTNLTKEFAYVEANGSPVKKYGPTNAKVPNSLITVSKEVKDVSVIADTGLNMRTGWSTDNNLILTIPYGTKLKAQFTNNGWAKVAYNKYVGFVSAEYLGEIENGGSNESEVEKFELGDVNGDGKISSLDYMLIKNDIMGVRKLTDVERKRADISKDGKISSLDYMMIKKIIMER